MPKKKSPSWVPKWLEEETSARKARKAGKGPSKKGEMYGGPGWTKAKRNPGKVVQTAKAKKAAREAAHQCGVSHPEARRGSKD